MVPEGWEKTTLIDLITADGMIKDGDWIESKDQDINGNIRLIQLADIGDGNWQDKSNKYIAKETAIRLKCTFLKEGDLLVARMPEPIGRACIFPKVSHKSITAVDICIIRVPERIDNAYLMNLINSKDFREEIEKRKSGTTRKRISTKNLGKIEFCIPPLPEQKKIAEILSSVDESIQATRKVIDQAKLVKKGLLQELLTRGIGHTRFKRVQLGTESVEIPVEWGVKRLGEILQESRERNNGTLNDDKLFAVFKEIGLIPMRDRVRGKDVSRCKIVNKTAFAYNPMRLNIGSIAMNNLDEKVMVSPDYIVFQTREKKMAPQYLNFIRQSSLWEKYITVEGTGSVRVRIYFKDLARLKVTLPPLPEQKHIATILSSVDDTIYANKQKLVQLRQLKKGLMQDLLTGK